jgi:hypothetical protein
MKKILTGILLLEMVAVAVFAEFNVTGYASGIITPYYTQDGKSAVANGPNWAGLGPQVQLSATGANPTGKAGYMFSVVASLPRPGGSNPLNPGQENYIWLKPFGDFLTLKVGGFNDYTLRSGTYYSALFDAANLKNRGEWQLLNEQTLFSGYEARVDGGIGTRKPGAILTLTSIENLYVGASFHLNQTGFYAFDEDKSAADYYIDGQYALGYTFDNIGQIKAQYIGADTGRGIAAYDNGTKLIQTAFKLTMLAAGPIEVGVTIPLSYDDKPDGYAEPVTIAIGTDLGFGKFSLKAFFTGGFGGTPEKDEKTGALIIAGLEPRYAITDTVSVLVPAGITFQSAADKNGTDAKDDASYLDIGAAIRLDLGASWNISAGLVYAAQLSRGDNAAETKAKFAIPIYFSGALF